MCLQGGAGAGEAGAGGSGAVEEDIDAILERAEVVDGHEYQQQQEGEEGGSGTTAAAGGADAGGGVAGAMGAGATTAGDLLTSFNVATFKNEEDDATFWSRLIPATTRPNEEPEVGHGGREALSCRKRRGGLQGVWRGWGRPAGGKSARHRPLPSP